MIYYTADQHFGHSTFMGLCNRPFKDIAEMDETLIMNWNSVVSADDVVYFLEILYSEVTSMQVII